MSSILATRAALLALVVTLGGTPEEAEKVLDKIGGSQPQVGMRGMYDQILNALREVRANK